jgi:hypothetical protein
MMMPSAAAIMARSSKRPSSRNPKEACFCRTQPLFAKKNGSTIT